MKHSLASLLSNHRVVAIVDNQFGDTGKGKMVDLMTEWADIIARGTGGDNAGHTVYHNARRYTLHVLPSGILRADGKLNVIGSGVALNPRTACQEIDGLTQAGVSCDSLRIAYNAKLVLPQHVLVDHLKNQPGVLDRIGTTKRGIGPAYRDHYDRNGLIVNDLFNPDILAPKVQRNVASLLPFLRHSDPAVVKEVMMHELLEQGRFYRPDTVLDVAAIVECYRDWGKRLQPFIGDTDHLVRTSLAQGKRILLEGAQGLLLSIDYGTYPYVTASDCSIRGLTRGVGLPEGAVDFTLGVTKAFYMTRVGEGPLPTELGGVSSATWCGQPRADRTTEALLYATASLNSDDPFQQGVAIRRIGDEYGATTGRPRRIGWLDLPLLRYAVRHHGPQLALTKVDVLDECDTIQVCMAYIYRGPPRYWAGAHLQPSDHITCAIVDPDILRYCEPVYRRFTGWRAQTSELISSTELPPALEELITCVERECEARVRLISVGPDREQTVYR
ncbi:MAG: Adenylosuccinate synthetase [Parcubacteria group bacterium Gr01-1014_38]|nr:MAG: Adenylosuccinate synthetase [Parcubacteria group bacterium Gr01-1014_38]